MFKSIFKSNAPFQDLGSQEFRDGFQNTPGAVILDVRTPAEYDAGYIPGAININVMDPAFSQKVQSMDKEKAYFVYCRSGGRSGSACRMMNEMGFTQLFNLGYGINGWDGPIE
ncbi:MAG: rhodanese-like domain-containing protein [Bacteroidia bacterium]|nr:rhodanese-like domain-containing protein [Bacteroidia bacterium]